MEPQSPAFAVFLESFEERNLTYDDSRILRGYGIGARLCYRVSEVGSWSDGERARAAALLAARLRSENDAMCVQALAAVGTPTAWSAVREALEKGAGEARAMAAYWLDDMDVATAMFDDPDAEVRYWCVAAFDAVGGSATRPYLVKALADDHPTIRWIACACLIPSMPLTPLFDERLFALRARLQEASREDRPAIIGEILALLDTLRRRETAEGLGYVRPGCWSSPAVAALHRSWDYRREWMSRSPYAEDLDLAAIDSMDGEERAQAAARLVLHFRARDVYSAGDCRVPRALLRLGVPEAAEGLAAVLPGSDGAFAVEIARALWHLARRPEALEKLRALETHADPAVRERARAALEEAEGAPG